MNFAQLTFAFSLGTTLALIGCGSSDPDPMTGTWSNKTCFGTSATPPDIEKCSVALTFTNELDVELKADWVSLPATAMYPRCTTTRRITGQRWSTEHATASETLTVTGSGKATIERAGCVNMADNMAAMPTSDISIPSGEADYQITGGTLTILAGDLKGTYIR